MSERPHLGGIESLRGYAALSIVVFHVIFLAGFQPPENLAVLSAHLGRGVPLFFVVSAFSLAYGYFGRLDGDAERREFYVRRLFRIAPLYYLAVFFQLAVHHPWNWILIHPWETVLNLFFLFNLAPEKVEGIALASWSIGVEMLFYAVLPVVLFLVRGLRGAAIFAIASFVAAVAQMAVLGGLPGGPPAFVQHGFLFNLPYFAFGLLAYFLWRERSERQWPLALIASLVGMAALVALVGPYVFTPIGNGVYQTLWAIPFSLLCLALAWRDAPVISWWGTRFLGRISFSLYLAHPHVIDWLGRFGVYARIKGLEGGPAVTFPAASLATIGVLIPVAWLLFSFVETPGIALGRGLVARLRASKPSGALSPEIG
ncbi:acyltransferase family protein [Phenylobacterium sp.]|uniref:acyltransferase family protein n=1 Tax=Phenylobacterium sp. TaxID=1871053 RepID=UPI002FCA0A6E